MSVSHQSFFSISSAFVPRTKRLLSYSAVVAALLAVAPSAAFAEAAAEQVVESPGARLADELSHAFEKVAEAITPSVVTISTETKVKKNARENRNLDPFREFFGDDFMDRLNPGPQRGLGTGVIVDDQGHILTNNHVIGDADEVTVRLSDERTLRAKVVGADPRTDLAVIKIKEKLPRFARMGDSDNLKIGEWVIAAGASFGLDNTITAGIVSAKGRAISGGSQYEDFIQTDAAINPGNSGGPLVNLRGEVVGINTAIVSKSGGYMGIGFAIPINMAKTVMESLIKNGKVTRGWMGVGIQNLTQDLAQSFNYPGTEGALVGHIDDKGPARKAGMRQGDIITQVDNEKIQNVNELRNYVASIKPGTTVNVSVIREGRKQNIRMTIGELSAQQEDRITPDGASEDLGLVVEEFDQNSPRRPRTNRQRGVMVTDIDPSGLAARADIQPGDVVVSVNGSEINNVYDFRKAIEAGDVKKGIRVVVESQGMERFAFLKDTSEE